MNIWYMFFGFDKFASYWKFECLWRLRKVPNQYVLKCIGLLMILQKYKYINMVYLVIYICILGALYVGFRYTYLTHNWYNVLSSSYHWIDFLWSFPSCLNAMTLQGLKLYLRWRSLVDDIISIIHLLNLDGRCRLIRWRLSILNLQCPSKSTTQHEIAFLTP